MAVRIYGYSDDLLEIEGDITEEICAYSESPNYLALSDGSVLKVVYDEDGIWRIVPVFLSSPMHKIDGSVENDTNDIVTINSQSPIKWAVLGEDLVR